MSRVEMDGMDMDTIILPSKNDVRTFAYIEYVTTRLVLRNEITIDQRQLILNEMYSVLKTVPASQIEELAGTLRLN